MRRLELWPRLQKRPLYSSALSDFHNPHDHYLHQTPLKPALHSGCVACPGRTAPAGQFRPAALTDFQEMTLEDWRKTVSASASDENQAHRMQTALQSLLEEPRQQHHCPSR